MSEKNEDKNKKGRQTMGMIINRKDLKKKKNEKIPLWEQAEIEMSEQMIEKKFTTEDVQEDLKKMRKELEE